MSYGLKIMNSSDELTMDSDFMSYALKDFGSVSVSVLNTFQYSQIISFGGSSTSQAPPLIAARWGENNTVYCGGVKMVGAPGNWVGFQLPMVAIGGPAVNITLLWRAYDAGMVSGNSYGMRVFSETGAATFDSAFLPLEVSSYLYPSQWVGTGNTNPVNGVRRMSYSQPNPTAGGYMILSTHRFGDLAYRNGVEGNLPVALVGYNYGYGSSGNLIMMVILQTLSATTNPDSLSEPNAYVSAVVAG